MPDPFLSERNRSARADEVAALLRESGTYLPAPERHGDFGTYFDVLAQADVVLLGEATHGTAEFYHARAAITQHLVEHYGFSLVAAEADWPDAQQIDRIITHVPGARRGGASRFPAWMWRNTEFDQFTLWLRDFNSGRSAGQRVRFCGLDVYSLNESISAVLDYLERVDPPAAEEARQRYACLSPWQSAPQIYGRSVKRGQHDTCEDKVTAQLQALLDRRLEYMAQDGESWFDAAQNARVVRAAEHYYRAMYHGAVESWNLRDRHMFDTLQHVRQALGPRCKSVVWAHNSHIGNAAATAMGWRGEFNLGELCRTAYGDRAIAVGFGTDRGTVAAADDWGGPMQIKTVLPARADSYERVFRQSGLPRSLTDLRASRGAELRELLSKPRLERAIGVIYRPDTEFYSHYFEAVLPEQFDFYVWFEETRAVAA